MSVLASTDVSAAEETRRELGPEDEIVAGLADRLEAEIDRRVDERVDERIDERLAARPAGREPLTAQHRVVLGVASLGAGFLTTILLTPQPYLVAVVWVAVVAVNLVPAVLDRRS